MSLRGQEYINSSAKRRLDVLGSLAIGAITLPTAMIAAAESSLEHRVVNPLFIHKRLGRSGVEFDTYKFRSLLQSADESVSLGGDQHPYASKIGKVIRATGIDELPQIINVLKGDMSLVGIRPMPAAHMEAYRQLVADEELFGEWKHCYDQNPGLTGEGQLFTKQFPNHDDAEIIRRRMEIDIDGFYDASLANDVRIIGLTPLKLCHSALRSRQSIDLPELEFSA